MRSLLISATLLGAGLVAGQTTSTVTTSPEATVFVSLADQPETPEAEVLIAMATPETMAFEPESPVEHRTHASPACFTDYAGGYNAAICEHKYLVVWVGDCPTRRQRDAFPRDKVLHCCAADWDGDGTRQFIFFTGAGVYTSAEFTEAAARQAFSMMVADPPAHMAPAQAKRAMPMQFFGGCAGGSCGR